MNQFNKPPQVGESPEVKKNKIKDLLKQLGSEFRDLMGGGSDPDGILGNPSYQESGRKYSNLGSSEPGVHDL